MKIVGPSTSLPQAGAAGMPARGRRSDGVAVPEALLGGKTQGQARPVRISRAPEEAALFAYNRQAHLNAERRPPKIDEYV